MATKKTEAGYRDAESETFRCGRCQFMQGGYCELVDGNVNAHSVCDLFSGHRPWQ